VARQISRAHDGEAFLFVLDLLVDIDREDWRPRSLEERKARLEMLHAGTPGPVSNTASTLRATVRRSWRVPASSVAKASHRSEGTDSPILTAFRKR
jgi:ATP-dependent DNA ligase